MGNWGSMDTKDGELLARYRDGQVEALEQLVLRYRRPLFGFILNTVEGRDDADEIFQEVWYKVIRKSHLYKQKNFLGWLVRIARNTIIDRARKKKADVSLDAESESSGPLVQVIAGTGPDPGERLDSGELGKRISMAVDGLPHDQKEVFVMRVQAGLPFKEIAHVQGVSINTALARMQYAIAKLRPILKNDYADLCAQRTGRATA